jgi:hypothetical protein
LDMGVETLYKISNDGIVMRDKQMYVPWDMIIKNEVLKEAH